MRDILNFKIVTKLSYKNHTHVKKVGQTLEFLFGIYWWTWKTNNHQKNCWSSPIKNNVAFKKKFKKVRISLSKSQWHDLQFLRYRAKQTEIHNFRSFFAFYPSKKALNQNFKKWKKLRDISSFYTCPPKITIIWCTVPEIHSETDKNFFVILGHFLPFYLPPPYDPKYQNFEKNEKHVWRCYPFIHTCVP